MRRPDSADEAVETELLMPVLRAASTEVVRELEDGDGEPSETAETNVTTPRTQ